MSDGAAAGAVRLRTADGNELAERAPELVDLMRVALGGATGLAVAPERVEVVRRHAGRPGFRAVLAERRTAGWTVSGTATRKLPTAGGPATSRRPCAPWTRRPCSTAPGAWSS